MSSSATATLQRNLGHDFKNARLLLQAITHKSFDAHMSNERLEFLRFPRQTGHRFHGKLDAHSSANWTLNPRQTGQFDAA